MNRALAIQGIAATAETCRGQSLTLQIHEFARWMQAEIVPCSSQMSLDDCEFLSEVFLQEIARSDDIVQRAAMALSALSILTWPQFDGGDGYWLGASTLASELTQMCLSDDGNELVPQLISSRPEPFQTYSDALGYAVLGIVANVNVDRLTVLRGVERSHIDPVIVVALAHPRLTLHDRIELFDSIPDFDWLVNLLQRDDGWYWPEYQEAFRQATVGITDELLIPVWVVALSAYARDLDVLPSDFDLPVPQTSRTNELLERLDERWDEHFPEDEIVDAWLDSLCVAVNSSSAVAQLAGLIEWGPSQFALACSSRIGSIDVGDLVDNKNVLVRVALAGNPASPRHALLALASDEHPSVREMIQRNPMIDDEIRTLAEA